MDAEPSTTQTRTELPERDFFISYKTKHNGFEPFRVEIYRDNRVVVKPNNHLHENMTLGVERLTRPYLDFKADQIEIGKSPLNETTKKNQTSGDDWDGNSFLFRNSEDGLYYYVGQEIFSFKTESPIYFYTSPVGNGGSAYPWALDAKGQVYLIIEQIILPRPDHIGYMTDDSIKEAYDPYKGFYEMDVEFQWTHPETNKTYDFIYHPDPEDTFDSLEEAVYIGEEEAIESLELGKELWCKIIRDHEAKKGIKPMNIVLHHASLHNRDDR